MTDVKCFKNRLQAGALLASHLSDYAGRSDVLVLALPRGGVPVGFSVAQALGVPLDILLVRKLGVPGQEEYAMGAIASGGWSVLQPEVLKTLGIPIAAVKEITQREEHEIQRREKLYRASRPPPQLDDRIVILVDDGLATGSTMRVAVQAVSAGHPARVIIAVPVAAPQTCQTLGEIVDDIVCLATPDPFYAVGLWYEHFDQTSDNEVIQLLEEAARAQTQHSAGAPGMARGAQPDTGERSQHPHRGR